MTEAIDSVCTDLDVVTISMALHHFEHPDRALQIDGVSRLNKFSILVFVSMPKFVFVFVFRPEITSSTEAIDSVCTDLDVVTISMALHHFEHPDRALQSMGQRVLMV
jgi:2-polyprenyl-3-methyl-5-hydroxy-6-metoxy-1,4-benzoquinol methylase